MRPLAALAVCSAILAVGPPARGYEFEVDAATVAQGYQLRWFRWPEADVVLNRRRFTQRLGLELWDLLAPRVDPGHPDRAPARAPFALAFRTSMRLDHDFGDYTGGEVTYPLAGSSVLATDPARAVVPELAGGDMELDVLYAALEGRDVLGILDFGVGRQLEVNALEWFSFDGASIRARTPFRLAIEAHGGLVTRERIEAQLASGAHEPDGTSAAQCAEWDEALRVWIAADECRQREALMPTVGVGLSTVGVRGLEAQLAYRRDVSRSPEGLYQAAGGDGWAVNHETLVGSARASLLGGGLAPWAAARWNFALARLDELHVGVRAGLAEHAVVAQLVRSSPTFDADSIFNVFSSEPFTDVRLGWDAWPGRGRLRTDVHGFLRRFESSDAPAYGLDASALAAGAGAAARLALARGRVRADVFVEDGAGGLRAGGDLSGRYRLRPGLHAEGRLTAIRFDDELRSDLEGVTVGAQGGARWTIADGIALHLAVEENTSPVHASALRITALLDLAFRPEL